MERKWEALPDARDWEIQRLREAVQDRDGVIEMILLRELRLREALERIKANRYGLQSLIEDGADEKTIAEYWANTVMEYQQIARAALAGDK